MKTKNIIVAAACAAAVFVAGQSGARADFSKQLPAPGTTVIGQVNGLARAVLKDTSGNCTLVPLPTQSNGGLSQHTWLFGGNENDSILVVPGTMSHCDFSVSPLITNGFTLNLVGYPGNDVIWNLALPRVRVWGSSGDDRLANLTHDQAFQSQGGSGNDFLYAQAGDAIYGEDGNDFLCIQAGQVASFVSGGSNYDTVCGNSWGITNPLDIENILPASCSCSLL